VNRRHFVAAAVLLTGSACGRRPSAGADADAIKQVISDYYDLFFRRLDAQKYRALLTDDYLLLENGEIFDAAGDIASMPKAGDGYQRSDAFEFRSLQVDGDSACAVYFLRSDVTDRTHGSRHLEWLESAVLRRRDLDWRVAVLHSTPIPIPPRRG
jgi:ketosteroid isomerase-like protein